MLARLPPFGSKPTHPPLDDSVKPSGEAVTHNWG